MKNPYECYKNSEVYILEKGNRVILINSKSGEWEAGSVEEKESIAKGLIEKGGTYALKEHSVALECTLYLSNRCNLGCKYCYSTDLRQNVGKEQVISVEMLEKIIPAVLSMKWDAVNFFLYGGEPLYDLSLMENVIEIVQRTNKYFKKQVAFSTQTNGSLFDYKRLSFIKNYGINVGISMDGPPHIHNRNRPLKNGMPSYEKVKNGIEALIENNIIFNITSTIYKPEEIYEVFEFFLKKRWTNYLRISPMMPEGDALKLQDKEELKSFPGRMAKEHLRVMEEIISNNIYSDFKIRCGNIASFAANIATDFRGDFCSRSPCGAGYGMIEFHPNGDVVSCDKVYYRPELGIFGKISELKNPEDLQIMYDSSPLRQKIASRTVDMISKCNKCPYKSYCGGGCTLSSYNTYGSFAREDVLCKYRKKMIEEILWKISENPANYLLLTKPWIFSRKGRL